jgi:hypothetical protein
VPEAQAAPGPDLIEGKLVEPVPARFGRCQHLVTGGEGIDETAPACQ